METRSLGASGLRVTLVGLGCNNFGGRIDLEATRKVVDKALDLGINHFDTADIYGKRGGSEDFLGRIVGDRRKAIVLATKIGKPMDDERKLAGGSRSYVTAATEASLKRLRTDWIDLLYMHEADAKTPVEETLRALDDLVKAGKVRHVAMSNYSPDQVREAASTAKRLKIEGFVACQDEYSLLNRDIERALVPAMKEAGLGLVPYFPLGGGALSGKYRRAKPMPQGSRHTKTGSGFLSDANLEKIEKLAAFAETRGHSLLELAMSWLARQPLVASIITGATKPDQLDANIKATAWALSAYELAEIDTITK
jgi:aryl-alcohol dehydrogenase-like predicted oxidoreductase